MRLACQGPLKTLPLSAAKVLTPRFSFDGQWRYPNAEGGVAWYGTMCNPHEMHPAIYDSVVM